MLQLGSVVFEAERVQQILKKGKQLAKTQSEKTEIQKYFETKKKLFDISKGLDILSTRKINCVPENWLVPIQIQTLKQKISSLKIELENQEKPNNPEVFKWIASPLNMWDKETSLALKLQLLDFQNQRMETYKALSRNFTITTEKLNTTLISLISDITYWIETIPEWIEKMKTVP